MKEYQLKISYMVSVETHGTGSRVKVKKCTIPKLNVIFFILVVRVSSQNFKIGPLQDFEKMRFWPILGLFLILGHFRAVFGPFLGRFLGG